MLLQNVILLAIIAAASAFDAVPLVVASHKLVKGLRDDINVPKTDVISSQAATNMVKRLISDCSADAYVIVDQPGLAYTDMTVKKSSRWSFMRKYVSMASLALALPYVEEPLDLDFLERYIIRTCNAETIRVEHATEEEMPQYQDTRKRVVRVSLPALPEDGARDHLIQHHDELLRKILRKVPSPHYAIVLTSSSPVLLHPVPPEIVSASPEKFDIFHDIFSHPLRQNEVERNDRFNVQGPDWIENKNTELRYLRNKKKDEVHLFDYDLWTRNERLVSTMAVMVLTVAAWRFWQGVSALKRRVAAWRAKGGLIAPERKRD